MSVVSFGVAIECKWVSSIGLKSERNNHLNCFLEHISVRGGLFERTTIKWVSAIEEGRASGRTTIKWVSVIEEGGGGARASGFLWVEGCILSG